MIVKEKRNFLFFCFIFLAEICFSQKISLLLKNSPSHFSLKNDRFSVYHFYQNKNNLLAKSNIPFSFLKEDILNNNPNLISPNFYTEHMGFFCKKELQFEKNTKVPFKFRLGSVATCDWLEGKPNAIKE